MAASAILAIKILADAKGAQKGMAQAETATSKWASGVNRAASVASVALFAGAVKATKGAADLAETMSKTETVFAGSSAEIEKWADGAAKAFGLSKAEALDAASGFQVMFTQLGIGAGTSQDMTKKLIGAAGDLASFHNVAGGTAEVTDMISSAMRGEFDSLQRLIPNINAAKVQQKALATTHKKSAKELTDAEKAAATYALVMEGLGPAAGDYAKTADGAANSQRTLQATMKDTSDTLGAALLPALGDVLEIANKFADWAKDHPGQLKLVIGAVLGLVAAVKLINAMLAIYRAALVVTAAVQAAAFLTNPIFLVVAAIALIVIGIVILWKKSEKFREIVKGAFEAVQKAAKKVWDWLKQNWPKLVAVLFGPFGIAVALIVKNWDKIKSAAVKVWAAVKAGITAITSFFKSTWSTAVSIVTGYFNTWKAVVTGIFNGIKSAISTVASWLSTAFNAAVGAITTVFNGLTTIFTAPFNAMRDAVQWVIDKVQWLIDKIQELIDKLPSVSIPDWVPVVGRAAPAPALSPAARGATTRTSSASGGIHITVNGAIDPEGTARAIKRVLEGHGRRVGTIQAI